MGPANGGRGSDGACSHCGYPNAAGAPRCQACGHSVVRRPAAKPPAAAQVPDPTRVAAPVSPAPPVAVRRLHGGWIVIGLVAALVVLIPLVMQMGKGARPERPSVASGEGAGHMQPAKGTGSVFVSTPPPVPEAPPVISQAPSAPPEARGGVFGMQAPGGDNRGYKRIVYVLDISGSMQSKIERAKRELSRALAGLKAGDTFNVIAFDDEAQPYSPDMLPVSGQNIEQALAYVKGIQVDGGTNISRAMEMALGLTPITHVFLLSDGQPEQGITDPQKLRDLVRGWNAVKKAHILTLALGEADASGAWGGDTDNISLLSALAADSGGEFKRVTLGQ